MSVSNCNFPVSGRKAVDSVFEYLLPTPRSVEISPGCFELTRLTGVDAPAELEIHAEKLARAGQFLHLPLKIRASGNLRLRLQPDLPAEGWSLRVRENEIEVNGGSPAGVGYAAGALRQLLLLACERGLAHAQLPCGIVLDQPSFAWRGFLLDSARQSQSAATVIRLLSLLAEFRINVFHWHLTDDTGWRIAAGTMGETGMDGGGFSLDEIRRITAHAARLGIAVVPEIDVPGHSSHLLRHFPNFACAPERPGREFCLGNPDGQKFLQNLLTEIAGIFPDSRYLHLGGDESETTGWERCPRCRQALHAAGYSDFRKLERDFMKKLTAHVRSLGKTPILWGTGECYEADTVIQPWTHLSELRRFAENGNRIVNSICGDFYLDYPATPGEPAESWMMTLDEATLYRTDPCPFWGEEVRRNVLGCEGCLWTEIVPEWRIMAKLRPRLAALSEVAWGKIPNADYFDYQRRRMRLEAAGYWDLLAAIGD